jgi:4-amino-4-deoxy-L-arabinose transferase-like glycosyltransferase
VNGPRSGWRERLLRLFDEHPWLVALGLVLLAAVLRFPDLAARGQWDADQGHDMLVLRAFVRDGQVPLLGPPTSIGDFHHGVLYYYLLTPSAVLTGGDSPVMILATIAAANTAAVAVVWWLGGAIGGRLAGAIAGLLMAVSPSAIEESTFIWNPNLIALSSAIALAGVWQAWTTRRARWWLLAAVGATVTMHAHVLGSVLLPPLVAVFGADLRRRLPAERMALTRAGFGGLAVLLLSYLPLAIHELGSDFAETRAAADFLAGGGAGDGPAEGPSFPARLAFIALRVLAWPLTGLVTSTPQASLLAAAAVVGLLGWLSVTSDGPRRLAARWAAATLAWSVLALSLGAPSLATVVPGLPNDHYHAFLDPVVFLTMGVGLAAIAARGIAGRVASAAVVVVLVVVGLSLRPPQVAPDGGWAGAERAGARILEALGDRPFALLGLPDLKSTDAYGYPVTRAGRPPTDPQGAEAIVVLCDRLFEQAIGAPCGGQAEQTAIARYPEFTTLGARFAASPRTEVSVYLRP